MVRRLLLYMVLVAAVAGFFLMRRETRHTADAVAAASPATLGALANERAHEGSHLSPDTRFLDAVGDVTHIATGAPAQRATCVFENGGWTIRSGGRTVGRLAEFPRFAEMRGLLVEWARLLGAAESMAAAGTDVAPGTAQARRRGHAAIEGALAALHAVRAADLADRLWAAGHRDAVTARLGARALTWMAAECFDEAGAGEAIAARAFAWAALAATSDSTAVRRETALLADVMGYPAEACAAAASLSQSDPIRLYVLRRDEILDAIASRGRTRADGGRGREARWLALRRCVERNDLEGWQVAAERGLETDTVLTLPVLSSQLALGRFETNLAAGSLLLLAVGADLRLNELAAAPIAAIEDRPLADAMELFETLLDAMPESADGAFLDRAVLRAWYRAAFYSSLMSIGEHLRQRLSDMAATRAFARDLGDGSRGPAPAIEFQRWFAHLADLKRDARLRGALKNDMIGMSHFGGGPRLLTWHSMRSYTNAADPFVRQCAKYLQKKLDTRPAHLDAWGWIVLTDLFDMARGEALLGESVSASHPRDLARRGWWAAYRGDRRMVDLLLHDPGYRPEERSELIYALRVMTPEDSLRLDAVSDQLAGERPDDWAILGPYVRALERRHRTDQVRQIASAWLARPDRSQRAFDDIDARNRLATACLEEGRIDEGYRAIQPVIGSWQGTAMSLAAELLDRKGEGAEAETLAMLAWQRYPDNDASQALVVDLLWRHAKYDLAARMLAGAPVPLSLEGWQRDLGKRFVRFQRAQPKEAAKAVDALVGLKLGDWGHLGGFVLAIAAAGRNAEAAELMARLTPAERLDPQHAIVTYRYVKEALGELAAADWLRKNLPAQDENTLAMLHLHAYGTDVGEAQWIVPLPKGSESTVENLWLMRVATALRDSVGTSAQLDQLRAHFASPGADTYRHFARLLLGLEPVDSILALRLDNRSEGEAYYYIALKHQAEGDLRAAADWYTRCIEVNVWSNGEHHWAMQQLAAWVARDRSLERLAAEAMKGRRAVTPRPSAI
ncbi:MAG: hypothetical protein ABIS67_14280 [Candidatus Eisenbacteria bacterium]